MKKLLFSVITVVLAVGILSACTNKDMGTVAGAGVGGVLGNVVTGGSAAGTVIGAVGGGYVGRQMSN